MALAKKAYATSNFACTINNEAAGFLVSFDPPSMEADKISSGLGPDGITKQALGNPTYGTAKCEINPAHSPPWMEVINSVFDKKCTEFQFRCDLANHDFKSQRAIEMAACLITKVGLGKLSAGDGKAHFKFNVEWECEDLIFLKGDDKVISGQIKGKEKNWLASNFEPQGVPGGIEPESIIDIECGSMTAKVGKEHVGMFRHPTRHYAKWDVDGLKTTHSSIAFDSALAYVNKVLKDGAITDNEYTDWGTDLKDQTMKTVLGTINWTGTACQKFDFSPQLKAGDAMSTFTITWVMETLRFTPKHV
ncbi:MAG: hypothetical protein F9K40_01335 [Kofleriaceae bacterium]|nr:MAG: hypothetical protein F9K40_01335 [Kofleriaceae bacterium]